MSQIDAQHVLTLPVRPASTATPVAVRGSEVVCRKLDWLWPDRVPLGKLTLLMGDPEQGKSFLTIDMAARVTRGRAWPDGKRRAPRGSIVILTAEDHAEDTVVPRLKKAGARLDRCIILKAARAQDGLARPLSLDRDLGVLRQTLLENPDCRLVVIDPISSYLGQIDANNNSDVRSLLFPLAELAAERDVAVVMVNHLNKRTSSRAMYRAIGSMAFVAVARAAWLVVRDPKDEKRRLLLSVKNNLTESPKGMAFRVAAANKQAIARIEWQKEPIQQTLAEALGIQSGFNLTEQKYRDRESFVVTWLREQLHDGPKTRMTLWLDGMWECVSKDQMYRAAHKLGVVMQKKGMSWDDAEWRLPEHVGKCFTKPDANAPARGIETACVQSKTKPPAPAKPAANTPREYPAELIKKLQEQLAQVTNPEARKALLRQGRSELEAALAVAKPVSTAAVGAVSG